MAACCRWPGPASCATSCSFPASCSTSSKASPTAQDPNRRRRGRRGLEILEALHEQTGVEVHVLDDEVPEREEVDAKLVALARRLRTSLLTVDEPLQRVAELQGVHCLSMRRLTESLRPTHVAGEDLRVVISRPGKEAGQGVGFLEDGTLVVVADAADLWARRSR